MRVMAAVAAAVDCTSRQIERATCVSEGRSEREIEQLNLYSIARVSNKATNERKGASGRSARPLAIVS